MTDTDLIARLRERHASHIGDGQLPDALCQAAADALAAERALFRAEVARRQHAEDVLAAALTRAELAECHAEALESERDRLRRALEPFSQMAGELFARNRNSTDLVVVLDTPARANRVTAGDFFAARAALTGEPQP